MNLPNPEDYRIHRYDNENNEQKTNMLLDYFKKGHELRYVHRYRLMRDRLKALYPAVDFDTYTDNVKFIMSRTFLVSKEQQLTVLTIEEQEMYSSEYNTLSTNCRKKDLDDIIANLYNTHDTETVKKYISDNSGLLTAFIHGVDVVIEIV